MKHINAVIMADHIIEKVVQKASDKTKNAAPQQPLVITEYAQCPEHGQYAVRGKRGEKIYVLNMGVCPICQKIKNTQAIMQSANFPERFIHCTFDNYETPLQGQKNALTQCKNWANDFKNNYQNGACLLLIGQYGTGKNHLAAAIIKETAKKGYSCLRIKTVDFIHQYWAADFSEKTKLIKKLANIDLLFLDEVGRGPITDSAEDALFALIDARYEKIRPLIIATNLTRDALIEYLGDAAFDRIRSNGLRIDFDWRSYRSPALHA